MNLGRITLALTFLVTTATAAFAGDKNANEFTLINGGRPVGKATYSIDEVKEGFRVRSRFNVNVTANELKVGKPDVASKAGGAPLNGNFTAEYRVAPDGNFLGGYLLYGGQVSSSFTPTKKRDAVTLGHMQVGSGAPSADMPMPGPNFAFAPHFDPASLQIFMTTALAHPHEDLKYTLLIPSLVPKQGPTVAYVGLQHGRAIDATGTLDGKTLALKKYTLVFFKGSADVYLDETGTLMQAEMNNISSRYVRTNFNLSPAQ